MSLARSSVGDKLLCDPQEVPGLECTVSLLCCYEEAQRWDDWTVRCGWMGDWGG